jgi:uncharacterized protein
MVKSRLNSIKYLGSSLSFRSCMHVYSEKEGEKLVKAARYAIELYMKSTDFNNDIVERTLPEFTQKHGVFVTIYDYPTKTLRGCIGFTEGIGPMKKLVIEAAIAAASEDPRFVPVSPIEFENIVIEVSVLSKQERIHGDAEQLKKQIRIGRDGLVIEHGYSKGLLLPIVAVEEKWSPAQFLDNVCVKAGLPVHTWKHGTAIVHRFSTEVFKETEPNGRVVELDLERMLDPTHHD